MVGWDTKLKMQKRIMKERRIAVQVSVYRIVALHIKTYILHVDTWEHCYNHRPKQY